MKPVRLCRVCGQGDWMEVVSFGEMPLANAYLDPSASYHDEQRYPLNVIVCTSCWLVSLDQVVSPELLYRNYFYMSPDAASLQQNMRHVVDSCLARFAPRRGSLVVEIGSNTGAQLELFREAGMRVLGVDPARNISARASMSRSK